MVLRIDSRLGSVTLEYQVDEFYRADPSCFHVHQFIGIVSTEHRTQASLSLANSNRNSSPLRRREMLGLA